MDGYLAFLKSLSEYQQRAEIGRLAFSERWGSSSLEEDILKALGFNPDQWQFELKHFAEEPDLFGTPVFGADQCTASFRFPFTNSPDNLLIRGPFISTMTAAP
jgi:hypothetical protein